MNILHAALVLCLVVLLSACGEQELYTGLSQRQANEMTAVLRNAGIDAQKVARDAERYAVLAPRDNFSQAIEVLRANGYPRDGYDTLGQVFKKEGFISSPLEERARFSHALSQEISNTIASIDGVVVARVHLVVPERDPLSDKIKPSSASVFIKHRPGVDLSGRVGQVKALVVNAIEGLPYDNVTVALFTAEPLPARSVLPAVPLAGLDTLLWSLLAAGAVVAAGGGFWAWRRRQTGAVDERAVALQDGNSTGADGMNRRYRTNRADSTDSTDTRDSTDSTGNADSSDGTDNMHSTSPLRSGGNALTRVLSGLRTSGR
jgi:type III secretion protein J